VARINKYVLKRLLNGCGAALERVSGRRLFKRGLEALTRGDLAAALKFFKMASVREPEAPSITI
jgi:hypothetical protein